MYAKKHNESVKLLNVDTWIKMSVLDDSMQILWKANAYVLSVISKMKSPSNKIVF